jgi:hypothetical protein
MYRRYEQGEFGNRFECWGTLREALESDTPEGELNIRHRTNGLSGFLYMNLSRSEVMDIIERDNLRISECHFTRGDQKEARYRTFQGEVQEDEHGWSLHYSFLKEPMRPALLKDGRFAQGLIARSLIRTFMDVQSYENLISLFDRFPSHVVEFTSFSRGVGILGWNTVFWEVRSY